MTDEVSKTTYIAVVVVAISGLVAVALSVTIMCINILTDATKSYDNVVSSTSVASLSDMTLMGKVGLPVIYSTIESNKTIVDSVVMQNRKQDNTPQGTETLLYKYDGDVSSDILKVLYTTYKTDVGLVELRKNTTNGLYIIKIWRYVN